MPEPTEYKYKCLVCGRVFANKIEARAKATARECEMNHDIVYIPLMRSDVQRLWSFFVTGDRDLLTSTLVKTIKSYRTIQ